MKALVASDIPAFLTSTREVIFLEDGDVARLEGARRELFSLENLSPVLRPVQHVTWDMQAAEKGGYKHFMLKEIMEQPKVMTDCLNGRIVSSEGCLRVRLDELDALPVPSSLRIIACGTSYHAGLWGRELLENIGGIPTELDIASEFRYRKPMSRPEETVMVISQSGETADTLAALRLIKERGGCVIGLCNVQGASIARESDVVLYTQAGHETASASTKACPARCCFLRLWLSITVSAGHRRQG